MAGFGAAAWGSTGITSGIALNTLVNETLAFVLEQLPSWRDDPERREEESEEKLNSQLCDYLNYRARHSFPMAVFHHEEFQAGRRKIDMSVKTEQAILAGTRKFTKYEPYLVIEGKRLPAPAREREKEYVTGYEVGSGGLQRFKLGHHGASLEVAAMVGYVQQNDPNSWLVAINGWIKSLDGVDCAPGCRWSSGEQLGDYRILKRLRISSSTSKHARTSASTPEIEVHHFWVSMRKTRKRAKK
jgi:hypothetical protein